MLTLTSVELSSAAETRSDEEWKFLHEDNDIMTAYKNGCRVKDRGTKFPKYLLW